MYKNNKDYLKQQIQQIHFEDSYQNSEQEEEEGQLYYNKSSPKLKVQGRTISSDNEQYSNIHNDYNTQQQQIYQDKQDIIGDSIRQKQENYRNELDNMRDQMQKRQERLFPTSDAKNDNSYNKIEKQLQNIENKYAQKSNQKQYQGLLYSDDEEEEQDQEYQNNHYVQKQLYPQDITDPSHRQQQVSTYQDYKCTKNSVHNSNKKKKILRNNSSIITDNNNRKQKKQHLQSKIQEIQSNIQQNIEDNQYNIAEYLQKENNSFININPKIKEIIQENQNLKEELKQKQQLNSDQSSRLLGNLDYFPPSQNKKKTTKKSKNKPPMQQNKLKKDYSDNSLLLKEQRKRAISNLSLNNKYEKQNQQCVYQDNNTDNLPKQYGKYLNHEQYEKLDKEIQLLKQIDRIRRKLKRSIVSTISQAKENQIQGVRQHRTFSRSIDKQQNNCSNNILNDVKKIIKDKRQHDQSSYLLSKGLSTQYCM